MCPRRSLNSTTTLLLDLFTDHALPYVRARQTYSHLIQKLSPSHSHPQRDLNDFQLDMSSLYCAGFETLWLCKPICAQFIVRFHWDRHATRNGKKWKNCGIRIFIILYTFVDHSIRFYKRTVVCYIPRKILVILFDANKE